MRYYEVIYIVQPNLEESGLTQLVESTKKSLSKRSGELLYEEIMGKKRLAYAIEKQRFGTYVLLQFQGEGVDIANINQDLELNDDVLAQLVVSIDQEEVRKAPSVTEAAAETQEKQTEAAPSKDEAPEDDKVETSVETPVAGDIEADAAETDSAAVDGSNDETEVPEKAEETDAETEGQD